MRQVDADRPYLTYRAEQPRIPASVAKLVTGIVALDMLGPAHRWHTEVLISGAVRDGRLIGDLYIKGYGDPYLTTEAYAALIRAIRAKGIEHIDGDLVFDDSQLLPPTAERGDFDGAAQRSYNALPAALSVNRQVTDIHIYNDHQNGRVGVYTEPPLSALDIVNEAKVVTAPCKGRFHRLTATFVEPEDGLPQLKVAGNFASECPEERVRRLILSPEQHAAAAFDALWRQLGGSIQGRVLLGSVPADAELFHSAQSQPLGEIIRTVNKYSDNLMARLLFLELGIAHDGPPGSVDKSRAALADWLAEHGFDFPGALHRQRLWPVPRYPHQRDRPRRTAVLGLSPALDAGTRGIAGHHGRRRHPDQAHAPRTHRGPRPPQDRHRPRCQLHRRLPTRRRGQPLGRRGPGQRHRRPDLAGLARPCRPS